MQALHLGRDVAMHVRSGLVAMARHIGETESTTVARETEEDLILSAAFNAATALQPAVDRFVELASIITELLGAWPSSRNKLRIVVDRLAEGLPTSTSAHFWRVQVALRCLA